ncbi:hypothetical protein [Armatimonas rosea]|uniref:Uncharacterized protein n=1 Tax=Armatimonas rosea TaxID=685828 RepID=A0A7W9W7P7_ARMRO|nr:hypothetical protein [Armatimonas rosea]MBB6051436.1 hypothetical protein [Armatimonas rosea]
MYTYLSALEIDIRLSNGNKTRFVQSQRETAKRVVEHLHPERLFAQKQLILAGEHSLSVYPCAAIERIDFLTEDFPTWSFPRNITDIVEIPESDFLAHYDLNTARGQRRFRPGESFRVYSELELTSGQQLFREIHLLIPPEEPGPEILPIDRTIIFQQLCHAPSLHLRRSGGGMIVINPSHLVRMTFYPGPADAPENAWLADSEGHPWQ